MPVSAGVFYGSEPSDKSDSLPDEVFLRSAPMVSLPKGDWDLSKGVNARDENGEGWFVGVGGG